MNYLKRLLFAGFVTASLSAYALPEPYASVRSMPSTPYFVQDGYIYYSLIDSHNAEVIVDVDSQDGSVARYIARQDSSLPSLRAIYSISAWTDYGAQKHQFNGFYPMWSRKIQLKPLRRYA